jgi:hypothetical protein
MSLTHWLHNVRIALAYRPAPRRRRRRAGIPGTQPESLEIRRLLTFNAPADYPVGVNPYAIVTGDFNGDEILDLATADFTSDSVSVLFGNADGSFQQPTVATSAGDGPVSLAVGDFNGDEKFDLAIANYYDDAVNVLLNNGDGSFGAPTSLPVAGNPSSVAVGDFNDDGNLDLGVISNQLVFVPSPYYPGYYYYDYQGQATVLLVNGVGGFTEHSAFDLGLGFQTSAVVGDFDLDGVDDLASSNYYYGYVSVILGDELGSFSGPSFYSAGFNPWSATAGDINKDGFDDLVVANQSGNDVSVLLADGTGGFAPAQNYATGSGPTAVDLGDFNSDGLVDIVTANWYDGTISVLYGEIGPTFSRPVHSAGPGAFALLAEDFNGDGYTDLATANYYANTVSVLINDQDWPPPPPPPALFSIDDVTVTEGDGGTVTATFTITRTQNLSGTATVDFSTGDFEALAGSDYAGLAGTLTFEDGVETQTISIDVLGDLIDEFDQRFLVHLFNASTGSVIIDSAGVGTIVDNDPEPTISITAKVSKLEGRNNSTTLFEFVVTLSAPSEKTVSVSYSTADGTATTADGDYVARTNTLVFAPGETTKSIFITVRGDNRKEGTETFFVNLLSATNGTIVGSQGIGEILEDDVSPGKGRK